MASQISTRLEGQPLTRLYLAPGVASIFGLATSIVNVGDPGVARLSIKDNWFILEGTGLTRRYVNPDFVVAFVLAREADIGS